MADTCIVCLGDLATTDPTLSELPSQQQLGLAPANGSQPLPHDPISTPLSDTADRPAPIAHLLPCGHNLHDECLRPWVERANSCPICRQNFRQVELRSYVTGPAISSYAVQEKKQTADIDPSMLTDEDLFDEPNIEPCMQCEAYGEDDTLLLCDGCNASCHTFCAGLDSVPAGPWFCQNCATEHRVTLGTASARGRGQGRRARRGRSSRRQEESPNAWAHVWQSVWDNLNLDLDFPYDDDAESARVTDAQRRDIALWQRRFEVAERQGGAARFRDTATALLESNPGGSTPQPESQEELRAWNAFEKAKEQETGSRPVSSTRSKRKSATASPTEPAPEPERRLKRPRTRRAQDVGDVTSDAGTDGPAGPRRIEASTPTGAQHTADANSPGPSFFQSLLKEVQATPTPLSIPSLSRIALNVQSPNATDTNSPASPSASSPASSTHPSPRMRSASPPPHYRSRPSSPPPLTSRILPHFSPVSPSIRMASDSEDSESSARQPRRRRRDIPDSTSSRSQATSTSPKRAGLSFEAKAEIQHMVTAALKPEYRDGKIDTEQYTTVNRDISRMLYDMVGEAGGMADEVEKERWQSIAAHEVDAALERLKKNQVNVSA